MNKKLLIFGLPILLIGLVVAISFYAMFSVSFNVTPAITIDGELKQTLGRVFSGETINGSAITITNDAPTERVINLSDDSGENVTVSYVGTLELTKKDVDFTSDNWTVLDDKVQIEYTVVGEEFNAKVIEDHQEETGYVLVYYADNDDRFANPGQAVLVEDVLGNLPAVGDFNIVNDYSGEYPTTPFGAKLWYVPLSALTLDTSSDAYDIDWTEADEFYFESSLIQYNAEGQITVYPGEVLDITPEYTPSTYVNGTYTITTQVA